MCVLCVCVHVYLYGVSGGTRVCFVCVYMCIYMVCLGGGRVCALCVCVCVSLHLCGYICTYIHGSSQWSVVSVNVDSDRQRIIL